MANFAEKYILKKAFIPVDKCKGYKFDGFIILAEKDNLFWVQVYLYDPRSVFAHKEPVLKKYKTLKGAEKLFNELVKDYNAY